MRQDLFCLLEIFDLKLLLEKLVFFLFQVLGCIFFGLVKVFDLPFVLFSLSFQLCGDMLDGFCLLLELSNLGSDLVFVVFLTLDHILLLGDLLGMSVNDFLLLLSQLFDLMKLVFLL